MNWYYADAGQQAGPIAEAELEALVQSGKINDQTLVWREGMANWQPYGTVKPGSVPSPSAGAEAGLSPAGGVVCRECGRTFPPEQVIRYGDALVCAGCKPIFVQRLTGATPLGSEGAATEQELLERDYDVDIGGYLSRAWEIFKADPGLTIGATALIGLILLGLQLVPYALSGRVLRTAVSTVLSLVLTGPLLAGLWLLFAKKARDQEASLADALGGFGPRFVQLMLTNAVSSILASLCVMPGTMLLVLGAAVAGTGSSQELGALVAFVGGLLLLVGIPGTVFLSTCWYYALPLVADQGVSFWPAMQLSMRIVRKHWWMNFLLMIVAGAILLVGLLPCCLGLLVTGPLSFAMLALHYQRVFGDLATT